MLLGQAAPVNFTPNSNRSYQSHGRLFVFNHACFYDTPNARKLPRSAKTLLLIRAGYAPPSKDAVSRNPTNPTNGKRQNSENVSERGLLETNIEGIARVPVATDSDSFINTKRRLPGNFGRLKTHKVKALIHRTSRVKQERSGDDDNLIVDHATFGEEMLEIEDKDLEQSEHTVSFDSGAPSGFKKTHTYSQNSDANIVSSGRAVASHPASHLRGWDSGRSRPSFKSESPKYLNEKRKSLAGNDFFSRKSFKDLGYSEYMIESLKKQFFLRPSHVQAMAFKPVIGGKTCVIADQSGSGKTLAYLAPIIQRIRQEELEGHSNSSPQAPRVVILAPTAELASQVLDNCRSMSKSGVPFKSMVVTGGFRQRTQRENLQQGVDVLIATPGRFMFLIKEGFLQFTNLRCAVLDEVDILLGDVDFEEALQSLINSSPAATQYLFVTATLPVDIYNKIVEVFPDCEMIMGPGMHRISARLEEVLVDCSGDEGQEKNPDTAFLNKKSALLQIAEGSPVPKTIVFCNKIETCRKVENALKRFDRKGTRIQILPFHDALAKESQLANMEEFARHPSNEVCQFLVCTDRASRGIDFAGVDHVILFDYPRDPSEYVRRVGRTARGASGKGKAFIFAVGRQVSLARRIMERNQKGHPLHDVPSAYELMK